MEGVPSLTCFRDILGFLGHQLAEIARLAVVSKSVRAACISSKGYFITPCLTLECTQSES